MRVFALGVVGLLFLFTGSGCVNMAEWNQESEKALREIMDECVARQMMKSELVMQVGQPTAKEVVEDGEIWVYDLADVGDTQTTGQVGPFGTFSATSSTPVNRTRVTVRFDKNNRMVGFAISGPARQQFRFLRPPQRQ
jgi:hypothetical protein